MPYLITIFAAQNEMICADDFYIYGTYIAFECIFAYIQFYFYKHLINAR